MFKLDYQYRNNQSNSSILESLFWHFRDIAQFLFQSYNSSLIRGLIQLRIFLWLSLNQYDRPLWESLLILLLKCTHNFQFTLHHYENLQKYCIGLRTEQYLVVQCFQYLWYFGRRIAWLLIYQIEDLSLSFYYPLLQ